MSNKVESLCLKGEIGFPRQGLLKRVVFILTGIAILRSLYRLCFRYLFRIRQEVILKLKQNTLILEQRYFFWGIMIRHSKSLVNPSAIGYIEHQSAFFKSYMIGVIILAVCTILGAIFVLEALRGKYYFFLILGLGIIAIGIILEFMVSRIFFRSFRDMLRISIFPHRDLYILANQEDISSFLENLASFYGQRSSS
jgi:hypothetical protein